MCSPMSLLVPSHGTYLALPFLLQLSCDNQADGSGGSHTNERSSGPQGSHGPTTLHVNIKLPLLKETPQKFPPVPEPSLGGPVYHEGILRSSSFLCFHEEKKS